MIIYGELLFLENFIIGGVILYLTSEICCRNRKNGWKWWLRLAAGAAMCGCFSMVLFLPVGGLVTAGMEAGFAILTCGTVYGWVRVWKKALTFLLTTYFMGGMIMGLLLLMQSRALYSPAGIYTGQMHGVVLAGLIGAAALTVIYAVRAVRARRIYLCHVADVRICSGEIQIETRGYCDTGNGLTEPMTGRAVAVADHALWERMKCSGMVREDRMLLLPCTTIAGRELMQAVTVDGVFVNGRRVGSLVIGKGPERFMIREMSEAKCELLLPKKIMKENFTGTDGKEYEDVAGKNGAAENMVLQMDRMVQHKKTTGKPRGADFLHRRK